MLRGQGTRASSAIDSAHSALASGHGPPAFFAMAWRIDESVIRGEIDNRTRGRVTGRIWFEGVAAPVELDLAGNAWRDLAGRKLEFVNPVAVKAPLLTSTDAGFGLRQQGVIGDCTASRRVTVPEVSMDELMERYRQRKPFPWHWGNSLYLEWFSAVNGRVVIESASFLLTVSPDIAWDMTPEEEVTQRKKNAEAMSGFMQQLGETVAGDDNGAQFEATAWNGGPPQSEAEAETMQSDREGLSDRISGRLQREGPDADYAKIMEEELARRARERGEKPLTPEDEAARARWIEEMNRAAAEAVAHPDPEIEEEIRRQHPLADQMFKLSLRLMKEPEARGWVPHDAGEEHPLIELGSSAMKAGVKLAGGLNGREWPPTVDLCAGVIVQLKRAREFLEDTLRAGESCAEEGLAEERWLAAARRELEQIARETDGLITDLRAKLERGCD